MATKTVKNLLLIVGTIILTGVSAEAKPLSKFDAELSEPEPSVEQAAISALRLSTRNSLRIEFGGCLFKKTVNGVTHFHFTAPATNGRADDFAITCELPSGAKLVGLFHTHPHGSESGISSNDIDVAKKLNVTSYVGFVDERKIMSFTPGTTRTRCLRTERRMCPQSQRVADGDFVAYFN